MAKRAKYRIGTLIGFLETEGNTTGASYGKVESIVTRSDGYSYGIGTRSIPEPEVIEAYKPIAGTRRIVKIRKNRKGTEAQASAN